MEKRASWALAAVALSWGIPVASAQADLTVSFATDGPAPALSVSVVQRSPEEPDVAREAPPPEPSEAPVPSVAPVAAPSVEVRFVRVGDGSGESVTLVLRDESGDPGPDALDRLSILARPRDVDAPAVLDPSDPDFVAPGIRRLHAGLLPLLARLAEQFRGAAIEIVSGYRPNARAGSRHRFGRALDLRVTGVSVDEVHAFLDGTPRTGVGLYPTSGFVHLDVRDETVRWTDESGPGEAPQIVRSEVVERPIAPDPIAPDDEGSGTGGDDTAAIEAAMRAADAIMLDFALPP